MLFRYSMKYKTIEFKIKQKFGAITNTLMRACEVKGEMIKTKKL